MCHIRIDIGISFDPCIHIITEYTDIGQLTLIQNRNFIFIDISQFSDHLIDIIFQEGRRSKFYDFVMTQKMNRIDIDIDTPHNSPSRRFLHSPPVGERFRHQLISGYHRNSHIPILHFDGVQIHFQHNSIGIILIHLNPVADADHIIGSQLDSGNESQDRILEDQKQHRGKSTQTDNQVFRRFIHQHTDDGNHHNRIQKHLDQLDKKSNRTIFRNRIALINLVDRIQ